MTTLQNRIEKLILSEATPKRVKELLLERLDKLIRGKVAYVDELERYVRVLETSHSEYIETKTVTPHIHIHADHIEILGEPAGLKSLGEMLILKAKLGKSASITFRDGVNKPIKIISGDELQDSQREF